MYACLGGTFCTKSFKHVYISCPSHLTYDNQAQGYNITNDKGFMSKDVDGTESLNHDNPLWFHYAWL